MRIYYEKYIDNLDQIQQLMQSGVSATMPKEAMIMEIRDNARRRHEICLENDNLLERALFQRTPGSLREQDIVELTEFADRLFLMGDGPDTGIAHYIHRLLLEYARQTRNRDLYIRELYHAGFTLLHVKPIVLHGKVRNPFHDQIAAYFEEGASYLEQYDGIESEETRACILRCCEKRDEKEYLYIFPRESDRQREKADISREREALREHLLDVIAEYHPPTYVHSLMVAWLGEKLCKRMVHVSPEKLVGTEDLPDADAVLKAEDMLCRSVYEGGLCHDIGKSRVLNYIGLYGRQLLDEEFACVKLHTVLGSALLKDAGYKRLARIALHHHQWVDQKGGYPYPCDTCPEDIRMLVEIVAVADSIDAATDNIGRSYASAKHFDELVEELRAGAGSRYSADVVHLLDDEDFYKEMERELVSRRQKTYCDVYSRRSQEERSDGTVSHLYREK